MGERPIGFVPDGFEPDPPSSGGGGGFLDAASRFASNFAHNIDPRPMLKVLYDVADGYAGVMTGNPGRMQGFTDDLKGLGSAQLDQFKKAKAAYDQGRISEAVGYTLAGAMPLVGPAASGAGEQIGGGDIAGGLGASTGVLAGVAGPRVVSKAIPKTATILRGRPNPNPVAAEAVAFGERAGIPIDAATATGSELIKSIQKKASDTPAGALTAEAFKRNQAERLATVGEQLAAKANAGGRTVTPEQAGAGAQQAVRDVVHAKNVEATTAYDKLRAAAEQRPETVVTREPAPIDPDASVRFTNKPNALPDEVFEHVYEDARKNGYTGLKGDLRRKFDDQLSVGFRGLEEMDSGAAELGPETLLRDIRKAGGLQPFDKQHGIKYRGDLETIQQGFNAHTTGWAQRGGAQIFRNGGLTLDGMFEALRQDPKWAGMLESTNDLLDVLDDVARSGPTKKLGTTTEDALTITDVRPGAQWWIPRTEETLAIPVDIRTAKAALKPTYERMIRESQLAPAAMVGDKAAAIQALDRLMRAPDQAALLDVDAALGDLKRFARADNPDLRTIGQGVVAHAVKHLDGLVRDAAAKAGPEVLQSLEKGRRATTEKYVAADVLNGLETGRGEAVQAYKRLMAPGDSAIGQLRDVLKQAPQTGPKLARAALDDLIGTATEGGGFEHAAKLETAWRKMGNETKALLFKDRAYISDLDNYFRLARKIAENPNTSGTARIANLYDLASNVVGYPVSKLLYSKTGVKLLTEGLRVPLQSPTYAAAYMARLTAGLRTAMQADPLMANERQDGTPVAREQR